MSRLSNLRVGVCNQTSQHLEIGEPTESDPNFKEGNISPMIRDFRARLGIRIQGYNTKVKKKTIVSTDGATDEQEEFVVMDLIWKGFVVIIY